MGAVAGGGGSALVDDAEDVCRLCFKAGVPITVDGAHPDDVDPSNGMIRLSQVSQQDLTKRGFSVQIVSRYSRQQALAEPARKEAARKDKGRDPAGFKLAGVLLAKVGAIHSFRDEKGIQAFRVIPDPTDDSDAHAKVLLSPEMKGAPYLKWRRELVNALGPMRPVTVLPSRPAGPRSRLFLASHRLLEKFVSMFGRFR